MAATIACLAATTFAVVGENKRLRPPLPPVVAVDDDVPIDLMSNDATDAVAHDHDVDVG